MRPIIKQSKYFPFKNVTKQYQFGNREEKLKEKKDLGSI